MFSQYALDYENKKPLINLNENTNRLLKYVAGFLGALILVLIIFSLVDTDSSDTRSLQKDLIVQNSENPRALDKDTLLNTKNSVEAVSSTNLSAPTIDNTKKLASHNTSLPKETNKPKPENSINTQKVNSSAKTKLATPTNTPDKKVSITKKTNTSKIKGNSWIKAQNPKHYTLQLIGGSNRSSAENFIKKHKVIGDAAIFKTKRKGKDWYSVIYKSYGSYKLATSASKSLPKSLKRIKPWVRSFEKIQNDIK